MYIEDKNGIHQPDIDGKDGLIEVGKLIKDGGKFHFYDDQTDNYTQKNYQLLVNHTFTPQWKLNGAYV